MGRRRLSREIALKILYQIDMTGAALADVLPVFYEHFDAPPPLRPFAEQLVLGVCTHREEIDRRIMSTSEHWRLERMPVVDRNVLRMAVFEMLFCPDIPPKVSINEAIDLAKSYGSEDSGAFINGILDKVLPRVATEDEAGPDGPVAEEKP
ncbi:MAG: transcription antitermination factor NusB [Syntrophobacteraceae bacterium]|jgi:N utilization substance protein B|nr:transcription antitermination factor NusB [Syntrophobacteraceae bacterium]